jgi:hypothetical protein
MGERPEGTKPEARSMWTGIIGATSSPLRFFALTVLVCNSIFGVAAAAAFGAEIFIYTLHTFLAVVAAFAMIALWSPRTFSGPDEIAKLIELEKANDDKPLYPLLSRLIPTAFGLLLVLIYAVYQGAK